MANEENNNKQESIIERIDEVIESEILDMSDDFEDDEVRKMLVRVCNKLMFGHKVFGLAVVRELDTRVLHVRTFHNEPSERYNEDKEELVGVIKVSSKPGGSFISWSDDENTGLSEACAPLYNGTMDKYDIATILTMINEAWYNCKS